MSTMFVREKGQGRISGEANLEHNYKDACAMWCLIKSFLTEI